MRITAIRATPVNIPYRSPARMSAGTSEHSTRTIIEIDTDAGLTGLGDATYAFAAGVIEREFAPASGDSDPPPTRPQGRLGRIDRTCSSRPGRRCTNSWAERGASAHPSCLCLLLPPAAGRPPERMAGIARKAIELTGADIFEFKIGVHDLEKDIGTIVAVHAALPGRAQIAVDANMALSSDDARKLLCEVAPLLENFEEPVASLREMDELAAQFGVPTSAHCTDLDTMLAYPHVDMVPTLDACGGISGVRELAQILGATGTPRVGAVARRERHRLGGDRAPRDERPQLHRPAQSLMDLCAEDLVLGERWDVRQGGVRAPFAPGLGVSLDRAALRACHSLYLEHGEVQAFPPALRRAGGCAS